MIGHIVRWEITNSMPLCLPRPTFARGQRFVPELGTYYLVPTIGTMLKTLHSPEHKKLAKWLKEQRVAKGFTMRELAARIDTTHSFVGKVEQRERKLDVIEFIRYCEALEVSPLDGLKAAST